MSSVLNPTAPPPPSDVPDVPDVPIYRLSVEQYHDLLRRNTECDREPVELLEGWVVPKVGEDAIHAATVEVVADFLRDLIPKGWVVRGPHPVTTPDSEPEPDVTVARGTQRDYLRRHPSPADAALVVEVANTSVRQDRGIKRRVYARAAMPAYWIVVLHERAVEVYTDPSGPAVEPGYATVRRYADGEQLPVVVDGREVGTIPVADLLP